MEPDWKFIDKLAQDPWFQTLSRPFQDQLRSIGSLQRLLPRQTIFLRDSDNTGMYCLLHGAVHVMNEIEPGHEGMLVQLHPTAWFGEIGLFDGRPHTHTTISDGPCVLFHIPRTPLLNWLGLNPAGWLPMSRLLTTKLRLAFFSLDELARLPTEDRLARRLFMYAAGGGLIASFNPVIDIHQEQLAQSLGVGRSTINPILRKWSDEGLIELSYGRITIKDLPRFKDLAGYEQWADAYKAGLGLPQLPFGSKADRDPDT